MAGPSRAARPSRRRGRDDARMASAPRWRKQQAGHIGSAVGLLIHMQLSELELPFSICYVPLHSIVAPNRQVARRLSPSLDRSFLLDLRPPCTQRGTLGPECLNRFRSPSAATPSCKDAHSPTRSPVIAPPRTSISPASLSLSAVPELTIIEDHPTTSSPALRAGQDVIGSSRSAMWR